VLVGIGVGLAGVVLLVWPFGDGANAFDLAGVVILLVAPLGWAHGSLYSARKAVLPARPLMATGLQMLLGSGALFIEAVLTGELGRFRPEAVSASSLAGLAYLTVFGSLLAFNAYAWLLRNAPLSLVGTYAYVNPVVAVALGGLILAEPITPRTLVASAVIVAAVAMIVTARGRMARPATELAPVEGSVAADGAGAASPAGPPASAASVAARGHLPEAPPGQPRLTPEAAPRP
jgi:drug/metabolite transporter (DMT)-like permease